MRSLQQEAGRSAEGRAREDRPREDSKASLEGRETVFGLTSAQITDTMRHLCKKAGLADLRFHDLRHEATSRFFENTDLDVMEIKAITGHKTLQMLARYTHLRTARLAHRLNGGKRVR
jgi:integrase